MQSTTSLMEIMARLRRTVVPASTARDAAVAIHMARKAMAEHQLEPEAAASLRSRFFASKMTVISLAGPNAHIAAAAPHLSEYTGVVVYTVGHSKKTPNEVEILLFGQLAALPFAITAYTVANWAAVRRFRDDVDAQDIADIDRAWAASIAHFGRDLANEMDALATSDPITAGQDTALSLIGTSERAKRAAELLRTKSNSPVDDGADLFAAIRNNG
jgi:hypothetical protein